MFKKYYNSDEVELKQNSELMFEEVSSGIYHVVKNRYERYEESRFVTVDKVILSLNANMEKIVMKNSRGIYANFELE